MEEDPLSICYCGWGYNRPMIRCCYCKHWYHYDCVNVTRRILEDAEHWYCFECIDYKPNSDSEDNYDFESDVLRRYQMNLETRRSVKRILEDSTFSRNSVMSMSIEEVMRSISCIEQQLLIEDTSYLVHNASFNKVSKDNNQFDRKNRMLIFNNYPLLRGFLLDTERRSLQNCIFSVSSYVTSKEYPRRSRISILLEEGWMWRARQCLMENQIPPRCIPINADVRTFNWKELAAVQNKLTGRLFDVIMMDPPWQLTSDNPSRGVTIKYQQLDDASIQALPLPTIQKNGLLFMWVINSRYRIALKMLQKWGYEFVCDLVWVKQSTRGSYIAQGNGFYLRHTKEICFVAKKGQLTYVDQMMLSKIGDVIMSKRTGQSQKPSEIYTIIESLVPNGYYIEIFGRLNNLRDNWVTIGNEI